MRIRIAGFALMILAASACGGPRASAESSSATSAQNADAAAAADPFAPDAKPALAALDAIPHDEWLRRSSRDLLSQVITASSRESLDEAAKTDPRAATLVGAGYHFGASGYSQNNAEAAAFYMKGAGGGNPIAEVNLGVMLKDGYATENGKRAPGAGAEFFQRAAEHGHPIGALNLAVLYRDGIGVAQDYAEAAKWFKVAADAGVAKAQYELGEMYYGGRGAVDGAHIPMGVPIDDEEGDRLIRLAADQGYADALDQIALTALMEYYLTEFENPDAKAAPLFKQAFDAYQRDAAQGDAHAIYMVGEYYRQGNGVPKDPAKAYAHLKAATTVEFREKPDALVALAEMTEKGEGVAKDETAAAAIFKTLAAEGNAAAEYNLARMTAAGLGGIPQDSIEALRLHKLAAQHGSGFAQQCLLKRDASWCGAALNAD